MWVREYINADSLGAYPKALTVDDSGNVYITGNCSKPNYISVFGTVKYNTNGIFQWERFFNGTANFGAIPYSITTDKNGNSYITGTTVDSGNIRPITTIKYDSSGNQKWIKKYFFQNNSYREGLKVQVDKNNYIYVGGNGKDEANTEYKFILIKYDTGGTEKWVRTYGCTSGYNPSAYLKDLTIDNYNNILVTGLSDSSQMGWDFTTLKYNSNGDWLWIKRYKKSFNSSDDVNAITVDRFNNVYVTGGTDNNTPWYQYLTVKYSQEGNFNWAMTYSDNNPYYYNHEAIKVKTDSAGNIYVTGNSDGIGTGLDIATIKYSGPSGIGSISNEIPAEYKLYQNYPNPFNNTTKIKYQIKSGVRNQESEVKIIVYDILGKEISSPVDRKQNSGIYEVMFDGSNLSTGIYFYRFIIDGIIIDNKKLVFVK
ncbi:MAG: SBBP repeat-containing protein [Ignavibacteriae bacterium]|nr:SBBP repeat-containing protein [Ignavibacteriota bacterium]